eukprot:jgi/Psemu1/26185/gm1.26185_g
MERKKRLLRWDPSIASEPEAKKQHTPSLLVSPSKSLAKTTKSESSKLTSFKSTKSDSTKCTTIKFTFDLKLTKILKKMSARIAGPDSNGGGNGGTKNFHVDPKNVHKVLVGQKNGNQTVPAAPKKNNQNNNQHVPVTKADQKKGKKKSKHQEVVASKGKEQLLLNHTMMKPIELLCTNSALAHLHCKRCAACVAVILNPVAEHPKSKGDNFHQVQETEQCLFISHDRDNEQFKK